MRVLLLHNPKAGANDISADDLRQAFRDAGWEVEYMSSDGPEFTRRLASDLRGDCDLVAAAGGDGTLARVINGVRAPAPPLALLPLGTANNIASSLGIAGDPRDLIAGLADADSVPPKTPVAKRAHAASNAIDQLDRFMTFSFFKGFKKGPTQPGCRLSYATAGPDARRIVGRSHGVGANTRASSAGLTGLTRCSWNPASNAARRSEGWP